jgi:uncharacterized protein (TIGR03437 family)
MLRTLPVLFVSAALSFGQSRRPDEYALILADPPVAQMSHSRAELSGVEAQARLQTIRDAQGSVLAELRRRHVQVAAAVQILTNAIFVRTDRQTALGLRDVPGVARVQYLPPVKRDLNAATGLINLTNAYNAVGGPSNAGAGIKIGVIDSGIDQNHPGFQDSSLTPPAGFPKCTAGQPQDCSYTDNKVIVAKSYVSITANWYYSPDDLSPRDRMGHGTAIAMIAAGVQNTGPLATIQGVAPKAFLGNYKVFGSPGVNDFPYASAISVALQDAFTDGMDVVTLSLEEGNEATSGPLDVDPSCQGENGECDFFAPQVENATANGMVVVTAAGNDGNSGTQIPTLSTIHTPGTAPSGITVGASSNAHQLYQAVDLNWPPIEPLVRRFQAIFGDGPRIAAPLTAPVVDVATVGNNGQACTALPTGSLTGSIALIARGGSCFLDAKINNAQAAGAVGVILYQSATDSSELSSSLDVPNTGIPAVEISYSDGISIKPLVDNASGFTATLDPALNAVPTQQNVVAPFSSRGPSIGLFAPSQYLVPAIKPELVAPGDGIYTATQTYDPNGDGYNASGYTVVSGTSYSVGFVAGAVALVKQKNPSMTAAQLKSAVVNTATQDVTEPGGATARVNSVGAGKLSVGDAVNVTAAVSPPTVAFGPIAAGALPIRQTLTISNVSGSAATFNFAVQSRDSSSASVTVAPASLTLAAGGRNSVTVTLAGGLPAAGEYEGFIVVTGAGSTLRVPYQFLVASGFPADIIPTLDPGFFLGVGYTDLQVAFRLQDAYGVPILNDPALFTPVLGGGQIAGGDATTLLYGEAGAFVNLGSQQGEQTIAGTAGGLTYSFDGFARQYPAIAANGVVNAASNTIGNGLAPGSYISIYGSLLSDAFEVYSTASLPVSLASVFVAFSDGGVSAPGHISFVSPSQINVQIPWEFQGHSTVQMYVSMNYLYSATYTLKLAQYSPGIFANSGNAAVFDATTGLVVTSANPAHRGDALELYLNGLGPVSNTPPSGDLAPSTQPFSTTAVQPTVTIGGVAAQVIFSGLAPGYVGLYQVNAVVPSNAPTGIQPLIVSIGGVSSQAANLPVQ